MEQKRAFESGHSASRNARLRGLALGNGLARCEPRQGRREPAGRAGHRRGVVSSQGYDAGILSFFLLVFKYGPLAQMDRARHYECRYWGSSSLSRATTNSAVCQLIVWQTAFSFRFPMRLMLLVGHSDRHSALSKNIVVSFHREIDLLMIQQPGGDYGYAVIHEVVAAERRGLQRRGDYPDARSRRAENQPEGSRRPVIRHA